MHLLLRDAVTRRRALSWAVLAAFIVLYAFRLDEPGWGTSSPPTYLFDESYTAFEAGRIAKGDPTVFRPAARRFEYLRGGASDLSATSRGEWSHPPFAPLAIAGTSSIFGWSAWGARVAALLAAALSLFAVVRLARRESALAACLLLGLDGVFFVFGRTALPHVFVTAGVALGVLALRSTLVGRGAWLRWSLLAGTAFGCATATRWTALPIAAFTILALLVSREARRIPRVRVALGFASALALTYVIAWAPAWTTGMTARGFIELHTQMLWFHTHLPSESGASSPPLSWPWLRHPVVFTIRGAKGAFAGVIAAGNPLLWWGIVPALVALVLGARKRSARTLLPLAAILGVIAPWAFASRFGYFYYLLPALPFVAGTLAELTRSLPRMRLAHLGLAATFFLLSYPVLAAVPIDRDVLAFERRLHGMP